VVKSIDDIAELLRGAVPDCPAPVIGGRVVAESNERFGIGVAPGIGHIKHLLRAIDAVGGQRIRGHPGAPIPHSGKNIQIHIQSHHHDFIGTFHRVGLQTDPDRRSSPLPTGHRQLRAPV